MVIGEYSMHFCVGKMYLSNKFDSFQYHRYCYECVNKATNERKCIVCGGHRSPPIGKMIYCELCPRAYHHDCYIPPLLKVPRGKWYCHGCVSKAPPPKKRTQKKPSSHKEHKDGLSNKDLLKHQHPHNLSQSLNSSHEESAPQR